MNNNFEQQIFDSLAKANRILVVLPQSPNADAVGAGLALFGFAKKMDKDVEIVSSAKTLGSLSFLPNFSDIKSDLQVFQSFVVSVSTAGASLDELSYETKPGRVDIFLKPKNGKFSPGDVSFRNANFPYDLLISIGAPSLEHLGEVYEKNTDLFFETTIINIDNHPNNEYYGEINHVDMTATSTAEILADLIERYEANLMDESIATNLLAGIIVGTKSFQDVKTTPKAFLKASSLIAQGGRHQDIIKELYKTKSISLLKLWGRSLARIKDVPDMGLVYSLVSFQDIEKTGSDSGEILGVMHELVASLATAKIIIFLAEIALGEIIGYFHLHPSIKADVVIPVLSGQMINGTLGMFRIEKKDLLQAEKEILEKLEKIRSQITLV